MDYLHDQEGGEEARTSSGLPKNMEAIEYALGEALVSGSFQFFEATQKELADFLTSKGIDLDGIDLSDLTMTIGLRIQGGQFNFPDKGSEARAQKLAIYERLKDRPSVKKVAAACGYSDNTIEIATIIKKIDDSLAAGATYHDVMRQYIYRDSAASNLAFVVHVEEKAGVEITTPEQLQELSGIVVGNDDGDLTDLDIENTLYFGLETLYDGRLNETLIAGGKYKDLLAISPTDFRLPEKWNGSEPEMTAEKMILSAINRHYFDEGLSVFYRTPIREIATKLEAPYGVVLRASQYELERSLRLADENGDERDEEGDDSKNLTS